jgi:hypothetical protein
MKFRAGFLFCGAKPVTMKKKKKVGKRSIPYCAEPEKHVLVETRECYYWRLKRGSLKEAELNEALARNVDIARVSGPAARQVVQVLRPFFKGLEPGRITLRISNGLAKAVKEKKQLDYSFLKGMEVQREYGLGLLLLNDYQVMVKDDKVELVVTITEDCVKRYNRLVSHYYLEAVLVSGEPAGSLRVESTDSKLYGFDEGVQESCVLQLPLPRPGVPWMLFLKVSCLEGNEMAMHTKHYGMKVVEVG